MNEPEGVAVDGSGNVYFADANNNAIKEWIAASNAVTTLVSVGLSYPEGVAVDATGNVYFADNGHNAVKKWIAAGHTVVTLVSNGLNNPFGVALDGAGNVYVADANNNAVKKWIAASNTVITLVSNGLNFPQGVAVDAAGNVYIADHGDSAIKEWTVANSNLTTLVSVGTGPEGVAVDGSGNVYFAATGNQEIQKWTAAPGPLTTLAASGLSFPSGVAVDGSGNVYFANWGSSTIQELPYAFVDPTPKYELPAAGSDVLPAVLPNTENLLAPFAPTGSLPQVAITGDTNGQVSFSFGANTTTNLLTNNITVFDIHIPIVQFMPGTIFTGYDPTNEINIDYGAPDGLAPLVIMGEYSSAGPLATPGLGLTIPDGTAQYVRFYGDNYDFTLYQLSCLGVGPNANEQTFQVVQSQHFSGSAPTGWQTLPVTGFSVPPAETSGTILAFAGTGPYYPQYPDDTLYSDATYENSSAPGSFAATPPGGPGTTFTVGIHTDPSANYEYIPDTFNNQGRNYYFGVVMVPPPLPPPQINNFSPPSGNSPQSLQPGTTVTIQGVGFTAGSQVMFGNDLSWVNPAYVSSDGTEIQAQVPRYGTTGNLEVSSPGQPTATAAQPFTVICYRNTNGFSFANDASFQNSVGGYTCNVEDTELFGSGQTESCWDCSPCLCAWSCNGCIDNPLADLLVFIANKALPSSGANGGQCFGFSLASQRFIHGDQPYVEDTISGPIQLFPLQAGVTSDSVWDLQGPSDGYSPQIASYIHVQHLAQLSVEFLTHYGKQVAINVASPYSEFISNSVARDLNNGDHPMMAISRGTVGNGFEGHLLVAYDLETPTNGSGDYCYIDVYDCDIPFIAEENIDTSGVTHQQNEQQSRIILKTDNQWFYTGVLPNAPWGGGNHFAGLVETDYGIVPVTPTMPGSPNSIYALLTTLVFTSSAQPTQVSDDAGHVMFNSDGTPNLGSDTSVPLATPFAPLNGTNAAAPMFLFGTNGTYTCSVTGATNGTYSAYVLGNQQYMASVVDTLTSSNINDTIRLVTATAGIEFSTDTTNKPLTLQVLAVATNGVVRSAVLTTTTFGGGGDTLEFNEPERQTVTYIHRGLATSFTMALWQVNSLGNSTLFISPALNVDTNGSVTFTPSDWSQLAGSLTVTSTNTAGQQQQTTIQSASPWQVLANGSFSLNLYGNIGLTYLFEASTNLVSWVPLGVVTNVTGIMQFTDTNSPRFSARFYRAVQQ